jgi:isopentenyl diphosphate isomerase/L-lactate dehydrogenase-like FMN-dependent dehydrogenase
LGLRRQRYDAIVNAEEVAMLSREKFRVPALVVLCSILTVAALNAQGQSSYPVVDKLAAAVVNKYQNASCDQLAAQKNQPPSGQKAAEVNRAVQYLHQNPDAAQYFINKVAAPIANKMFQCGMIP